MIRLRPRYFGTKIGSCDPKSNLRLRPLLAATNATTTTNNHIHGAQYFTEDKRPIILFDGVCNLCNGGVQFMLDNDVQGKHRFAALQSIAGSTLLQRAGRSPTDISSIVLVEENQSYIKSDAILKIAQRLDIPFPLLAALGFLFPLQFRDFVYDGIADNRYQLLGKTNECRMKDDRFSDRFLVE